MSLKQGSHTSMTVKFPDFSLTFYRFSRTLFARNSKQFTDNLNNVHRFWRFVGGSEYVLKLNILTYHMWLMHPHIIPQRPIHIQSSAVIALPNLSRYYIRHCNNKRQKGYQISESQQTPHNSPSRASYGVSIVRILEKNDRVRTAPHCICFQNDKRDHISYINWYVHPGVPYKMIKWLISYLPIKYVLSLCGQVWWHGIFWWQF